MADTYDIIISAVDSASDVFQSLLSTVEDAASGINDAITGVSDVDLTSLYSEMDTLEAEFEEATLEVERLEDALDEAHFNGDDIEADIIADELAEARERAEELEEALNILGNIELGALEGSIQVTSEEMEQLGNVGIDFDTLIGGLGDVGSEVEDVGESAEETATAFEQMGSAGEVMGASSLLEFAQSLSQAMYDAADSAGTFSDSVNRAELEATGAGIPIEDMKKAVSDLGDATGRSGSQIRENFIKATARGVTDLDSFKTMMEGAGAQAYLFNTDIQSMGDKFSGLAMKSSLMEKALAETGITMNELADAMGISGASADEVKQKWKELDANQRAALLGTAASMNEGKTANDEYKTSWAGLQEQVNIARGRLERIAGSVILPVLIPAMQLAGDILQGVGDKIEYVMNSPLGGLVSILGTAAGLFIALVAGVSAASTIIGFLGLESTFASIELWALALAGDAEALAALGVEGGSLLASTGLGAMATAAWGAATAVWALISPLLPFIAAAALIAIAVYEVGKAFGWWTDVGSMIDAIGAGLQRMWDAFINHPDVQAAISAISGALQWLWSAVQQAGQAVMDFFGINSEGNFDVVRTLIDGIGLAWEVMSNPIRLVIEIIQSMIGAFESVSESVSGFAEFLGEVWTTIMSILAPYIGQIVGLVMGLIGVFNLFKSGQIDLPTAIATVLGMLWNSYTTILSMISSAVLRFAGRMLSYAVRAATNFVNGIVTRISQLPGRVGNLLRAVVAAISGAVSGWISAAVSGVQSLVSNVVSRFSSLPNGISSALGGVVSAITSPFKQAYDAVVGLVDDIKSKVQEGLNEAAKLVGAAGGDMPMGGDLAAGGDLVIPSNDVIVSYDNSPIEVEHTLDINLSIDAPSHISTDEVARVLTDRNVIRELVNNRDFQLLDGKAKERLNLKVNRSRGV